MMEKNANYMHTEYTMGPSDHRNDMHWCHLRFNSPPLHYVLMTKKMPTTYIVLTVILSYYKNVINSWECDWSALRNMSWVLGQFL